MFRKILNIIHSFFFASGVEEAGITMYVQSAAAVQTEWLKVSCKYVRRLMYHCSLTKLGSLQ